jgi:precorrin-3B C17-methyltransferase
VVGIGPGGKEDRTHRAEQAIASSNVIAGYTRYLSLVEDLTADKELISSGMTKERDRCQAALLRAQQGDTVALISSGDAGIYGMAGLAIEMAAGEGIPVSIEIVPGITAAGSAAARLGAPLMLDFACISLSDLLVPWDMIRQRLQAVASADLVTALYNPRSKRRRDQLEEAASIFLKHREGSTPVGIATAVGTEDERIEMATLNNFLHLDINMRSIVVIGNSSSRVIDGFFVTPRGYQV